MAENRVTLIVEGSDRDGGHVRLDVFLKELQRLQGALAKADASVTDGQRNSYFAIVGLSHSSPAIVELEPRVSRGRQDVRPSLFQRVIDTIESIENDKLPPDVDYELLSDLRGLAAPVGSELKSATLKINGGAFVLTETFAKRADVFLSEHESCFGAIEGMLERINVHAEANVFTIYPDIGPKSITCHFSPELIETAVSAVKRRVSVSGLLKYRKLAPYPYQLDVREIDIYDPQDTLTSFDDLRGIAPDATGDLSSEAFVARFRDGWY